MATFPGAVPVFPTRVDGTPIEPSHMNALQDEVTAVATHILVTPPGPVTTSPITVAGAEPALTLNDPAGGAVKGRLLFEAAGALDLAINAGKSATGAWVPDDAAAASALVQQFIANGHLAFYHAPGGAADPAWSRFFHVDPPGAVSQMVRGVPIGEWATYPLSFQSTGGNAALGNGTLVGRYTVIGKTVHCRVTFSVGSTTVQGTGWWYFTIPPGFPIAGWVGWDPLGHGRITGGTQRMVHVAFGGATHVYMVLDNSTAVVGPGQPWAWAAGYYIYLAFTYETP